MKSYTDLEQSKNLADILPVESADMWYEDIYYEDGGFMMPRLGNMPKEHSFRIMNVKSTIIRNY